MWDFIISVLMFDYIGPMWVYRLVFGLSLLLNGLLILTLIVFPFNDSFDDLAEIIISRIYFVCLLATNIILVLVAPKTMIIISLIFWVIIITLYAGAIYCALHTEIEDQDDAYEFN
jgi:hypothetical protein